MSGLSAKMLWSAYDRAWLGWEMAKGAISLCAERGYPDDGPRRYYVRDLRRWEKLRIALPAKLDADAQERDALRLQCAGSRLQCAGAQDALERVMEEFRAYRETREDVLRQARAALLQPSSIMAKGEWGDWWLECGCCRGRGPVQDDRLSSVVHREDCEREKLLAAIDAALGKEG